MSKKFIAVCVMTGSAHGGARSEIRTFGTTVSERQSARAWITSEGCTEMMMESTGAYWKPVFRVGEGHVRVALANAQEGKARKGHKTDNQDACWLAHLLRHGMSPRAQRELWGLMRRRAN